MCKRKTCTKHCVYITKVGRVLKTLEKIEVIVSDCFFNLSSPVRLYVLVGKVAKTSCSCNIISRMLNTEPTVVVYPLKDLPGGFDASMSAIIIQKILARHLYHISGHIKFLFKKTKNDKKIQI